VRALHHLPPVVADDAAPAQLITLILFMNWCYTQNSVGKKQYLHTVLNSTILLTSFSYKHAIIKCHAVSQIIMLVKVAAHVVCCWLMCVQRASSVAEVTCRRSLHTRLPARLSLLS